MQSTGQDEREALLPLWDRIGIAVRCGYHPFCPCVVHAYLDCARHVVAHGLRSETAAQRRVLDVLLQTARDPALSRYWRNVCMKHAILVQIRLQTLLEDDPVTLNAVHSAVQVARDVLAAGSPSVSDRWVRTGRPASPGA